MPLETLISSEGHITSETRRETFPPAPSGILDKYLELNTPFRVEVTKLHANNIIKALPGEMLPLTTFCFRREKSFRNPPVVLSKWRARERY
ncbi:hypothetical protein TNCT_78731 [Trichonephila clavata]|uniref:Uncharacterized protein n=1 Tax=Trichonephila clavata TaxID=2740835 RepID=A0A8X6GNZ2_TRICU|nr:hypothetical protein TNCT_78731 [Trichonephila clavata]